MYSKLNELLTDYFEVCVCYHVYVAYDKHAEQKHWSPGCLLKPRQFRWNALWQTEHCVTDVVDIILHKQEVSAIRNGFFSELYLLKVSLLCCYSRNTLEEKETYRWVAWHLPLLLVCLFMGWSVCCLVTLWVYNWAVIYRMYTWISLNVLLWLLSSVMLSSSIWMCQTEPKARFCRLLERRITTLQFLPYKSYFTLNGLKQACFRDWVTVHITKPTL